MRRLILLAMLPLMATFAPLSLAKAPELPRRPTLWAEPVPLREDAAGARQLGGLTFLEGWWLRSAHPHFGGISALHMNGRNALALSDGGVLIRFELPTRAGRVPLRIEDLPDAPGPRKTQRDSEAMTVHGGRAWVGFERKNAVFRYDMRTWRSEASAQPAAMRQWPLNSGSEAMIRLADGRFLIFSEGERLTGGGTEALLFSGDPALEKSKAVRLAYRAPEGYRITDAAELPDGRLMFLNRRISLFDGMLVKLTIAPRQKLKANIVLSGADIAHFAAPVVTDNYEALSIGVENGRTILWIASDDNYMGFQRTLLLKFFLK